MVIPRGGKTLKALAATLVALLLFLAPAAEAALTVAVNPFLSQGSSLFLGSSVSEILGTELVGTREVTVVERSQLGAVANQQKLALSGVVPTETAVKAGRLVGARYFVLGAVSRFGSLLVLTARLVDVESGAVLKSFEQTSRDGEQGVTLATKNLAAEMIAFFSGGAPTEGAPMDDYRYYLYEALGYYNLGDYRRSLPHWERMTKLNPKDGLLRFIVAGVYYQAGRYNDSLLAAQQAVTWDPSFAEAHLLVGKAYFMMGDDHKATPALDRALELNPRLAEALFLKGQAYKNRKRLDEAVDLLVAAIEADGSYIPAYLSLGQLLIEVGAAEDAVGVLLPARNQEPENAQVRFLLAMAQYLRGNRKGAEEEREVLKGLDPSLAEKLGELLQ